MIDSDLRRLDALDDAVQARFRDLNGRFGISRLMDFNKAPHRFEPEHLRELQIVRDLEHAQLRVVLYLASRDVLTTIPSPLVQTKRGAGIHGPVLVTTEPRDSGLAPAAKDLRDEARRAMLAFRGGDSHEFVVSTWRVTARPVRASQDACVMCHQVRERGALDTNGDPVRLGTALGVVMYGYQKSHPSGSASRRKGSS